MNLSDLLAIMDKAFQLGVSEMTIEGNNTFVFRSDHEVIPSPKSEIPASGLVSDPIQHKTEQLQSLLKLDDKDLLDQLYPDHTDQSESA